MLTLTKEQMKQLLLLTDSATVDEEGDVQEITLTDGELVSDYEEFTLTENTITTIRELVANETNALSAEEVTDVTDKLNAIDPSILTDSLPAPTVSLLPTKLYEGDKVTLVLTVKDAINDLVTFAELTDSLPVEELQTSVIAFEAGEESKAHNEELEEVEHAKDEIEALHLSEEVLKKAIEALYPGLLCDHE